MHDYLFIYLFFKRAGQKNEKISYNPSVDLLMKRYIGFICTWTKEDAKLTHAQIHDSK